MSLDHEPASELLHISVKYAPTAVEPTWNKEASQGQNLALA